MIAQGRDHRSRTLGLRASAQRTLKGFYRAKHSPDRASVPHILLIPRDSVLLKNTPELVLKRDGSVMLILSIDIPLDDRNMYRTHRKCTVSQLPMEVLGSGQLRLDPFRRFPFEVTNQICHCDGPSHVAKDVNVISCASGGDRRAVQIGTSRHQILMYSCPKWEINQKRATLLGGEHQMQVNLCQRLRHVGEPEIDAEDRVCSSMQRSIKKGNRHATDG